jgi:hypothetical protein
MDDHLFKYRQYNPGNRAEVLCGLAQTTAKLEGCLVVDIHEYVFDELLFPEWRETCHRLLQYLAERSDFWMTTPDQVARHWSRRHELILQASQGLAELVKTENPGRMALVGEG